MTGMFGLSIGILCAQPAIHPSVSRLGSKTHKTRKERRKDNILILLLSGRAAGLPSLKEIDILGKDRGKEKKRRNHSNCVTRTGFEARIQGETHTHTDTQRDGWMAGSCR